MPRRQRPFLPTPTQPRTRKRKRHLIGPSAGIPDAPARARAAAERAIELDETLAEAHTSLARLLHRIAGDVDRADVEYRRAIELNPGYATAHQWYGTLLAESGRHKEAQEHGERAVALDPLSAAIRQSLALMYFVGRHSRSPAIRPSIACDRRRGSSTWRRRRRRGDRYLAAPAPADPQT